MHTIINAPRVLLLIITILISFAQIGAHAVNLNFDPFQKMESNRTAVMGGTTYDTAANLLDPQFNFVGAAIFQMPHPFSPTVFKQRVLNSLPDQWKYHAATLQKFSDNFIILEYCSWPEYKAPCGQLTLQDWSNYVGTMFNQPLCKNRRLEYLGSEFAMHPFYAGDLSVSNSTLIRFTFQGAERSEYIDALNRDEFNGLCSLVTGTSATVYALATEAANSFDKAVGPRSIKLPSRIDDFISKLKRRAVQQPADTGAVAAIIVIILIFLLCYCGVKLLSKKNDDQKNKFEQEQQRERQQQHQNGDAAGVGPTSIGPGGARRNNKNDDDSDNDAAAGGNAYAAARRRPVQDDAYDVSVEMTDRLRALAAKRAEMMAKPADSTSAVDHVEQHQHSQQRQGHVAEHDGNLEKVPPSHDDDDDGKPNLFRQFVTEQRPTLLVAPPDDDDADHHRPQPQVRAALPSAGAAKFSPREGSAEQQPAPAQPAAAATAAAKPSTTIDDVFA